MVEVVEDLIPREVRAAVIAKLSTCASLGDFMSGDTPTIKYIIWVLYRYISYYPEIYRVLTDFVHNQRLFTINKCLF